MCDFENPTPTRIIENIINHVRALQVEEHKLQRYHPGYYHSISIHHHFFSTLCTLANSANELERCNNHE